jgi:hypothetical protein
LAAGRLALVGPRQNASAAGPDIPFHRNMINQHADVSGETLAIISLRAARSGAG